ncbi:F-box/RNI-like superfamily protein [Actinidia rufa]|uniref:F-box/RNI-like superfamily protein n=1 Tax=Actinidia rufa TaxID=165716 RepID=A0A7J0H5K7_9ERIC|nr:F-box/RNI-like superfamily protein [Actinidia rufa]
MDNVLVRDSISDLPESIIETILTKLPIRDAVRTSILSTKWRYKWANLTHLVFDGKCGTLCNDKGPVEDNLVKFITRLLFLHDGPIHNFSLSSAYLQSSPDIDQWLLFLSRKDIKELVLELGEGDLALTIRAPNLKYLCLEGEFKDICLENTPLLVSISVAMYMTDDIAERFEQSSSCNFTKFLGGVPFLERLIGHIYFTKYLSIGNQLGKPPITYGHLQIVELYQVSFEDMKEILVVLRLIVNSPSLEELQISGSSNTSAATEASDLDFGGKECPTDCTFGLLKTVKMTDMSGVPHEMEFIKFLLGNSPVLKIMSVTPSVYGTDARINMLIELLRFRRASPDAEITFIQD